MTARADKDGAVRIAGIAITHPGRVLYPKQGATKRDLAEYYVAMADRILPFLAGRPLSLVRCPSGEGGNCFFQKHHNDTTPPAIKKIMIAEKSGKKAPYLMINNLSGLIASAQIGALELHVWGARADRIEQPERIVFDLDLDEGVSFARVREAARDVRDLLKRAGLESFPLITGGKGIHVIAPIERRSAWPEVKSFSRALATTLEAAAPDRYVASAPKARRKGKIFIDWLRNERGATAVAPYSPRARDGAPIATPVTWSELTRLASPAAFTLSNIGRRIAALKSDPWDDYRSLRQVLTKGGLEAQKS
ncbi:MAG TPA: non-homologous end-joining DNA ligase [Parvularculaceae bacterium]|nr:non-homologous end-joining DNA ligase [Parvularculaceae bacterium]